MTKAMRAPFVPETYLKAARVPAAVAPQTFGPWTIERRLARDSVLGELDLVGADDYTLLRRHTPATLHLEGGEIVMEDSVRELSKHLPIWLAARGRVLKTGLGLGCVVRGLLANPAVEHVDVVEIDAHIVRVIGAEFAGDPRVTIHHADALTWDFGDRRWDYAWHDIWTEGNRGLQRLHMDLIMRFWDAVGSRQGAWAFPRLAHRASAYRLLGGPKTRRQRAPRMAKPPSPAEEEKTMSTAQPRIASWSARRSGASMTVTVEYAEGGRRIDTGIIELRLIDGEIVGRDSAGGQVRYLVAGEIPYHAPEATY